MKLEGMKINFLGDSITEVHSATCPENVFNQVMKRKYGLAKANNYGVGGTRIARQTVPSENKICDYTFEVRAEVMDRDVDAVVVFGGTNDFGHGDAKLGDIESNDIYTFSGALNSLITKLLNDFPGKEIIFMTPLHRTTEDEPSQPEGKILSDYVDVMRQIFKKRNIKYIDLFEIDPFDIASNKYSPDGLHPNDLGHEILADTVAKELMKL